MSQTSPMESGPLPTDDAVVVSHSSPDGIHESNAISKTTARQIGERIESTLDCLDTLCRELLEDADYTVPPVEFYLPQGFVLSIVIPVYNERDTILSILARVRALPVALQIVLVDDCSTDGTVEILRELESLPDVCVLFKPRNEGKGAALRTGFRHATGDVVVVQDADMEYDPRDLLPLLRPIIEGNADVVYGSRFSERGTAVGSSPIHRFGNRMLTRASNLLTGLSLTDMETCYKLFRRHLLSQIEIEQNRFGFEPEITAKIARRGWRVAELPINYRGRSWADGKKIGFRDLINACYCIVRYGVAD